MEILLKHFEHSLQTPNTLWNKLVLLQLMTNIMFVLPAAFDRSYSLSAFLKSRNLADIGLQYEFFHSYLFVKFFKQLHT